MYFQKLPLFYLYIWEYMGYTLLSLLLNCNLIGNNNDKPSKYNKDNQNHKLLPKAVALFDTPPKKHKIANKMPLQLCIWILIMSILLFLWIRMRTSHTKKKQFNI